MHIYPYITVTCWIFILKSKRYTHVFSGECLSNECLQGVTTVSFNSCMSYGSNMALMINDVRIPYYCMHAVRSTLLGFSHFLAHDRMSVASLCNPDLSVVVVVVVVVIVVVCEHSSWPHAWPNKVHTLHAHAAISCIVAYQKLYHSDLYLLYSSHICMFILMSIVHKVINIATSN